MIKKFSYKIISNSQEKTIFKIKKIKKLLNRKILNSTYLIFLIKLIKKKKK